jgi:hypothetical protein
MPTAFVRYRSGGGFQKVNEYTRVFDSRKLVERGYYRDSGFTPMAVPAESANFAKADMRRVTVGPGSDYQQVTGTFMEVDVGVSGSPPNFSVQQPDEVSHTAPRQLRWNETVLTFANDDGVSAVFTADNATNTINCTAHPFSGKRITLQGSLPTGLFTDVMYYVIQPTADSFKLSLTENGSVVAFTTNGSGTLTATVVDVVAEFPWANILGWSDTAPTR